ncbi:hypothetical protein OESDEN_18276, partial [Oesophagostomum dentatum]
LQHGEHISIFRAILKFVEQTKGRPGDCLIYYIPCSYQYSQDRDTKQFIKALRNSTSKSVLMISNTHSSDIVSKTFSIRKENVVGTDNKKNMISIISNFVASSSSDPWIETTTKYSTSPEVFKTTAGKSTSLSTTKATTGPLLNETKALFSSM